jgi:hypothetical protein
MAESHLQKAVSAVEKAVASAPNDAITKALTALVSVLVSQQRTIDGLRDQLRGKMDTNRSGTRSTGQN